MSTKSNELIRNYLTENSVVVSLDIKQANILHRLFYSFAVVVGNDTKVEELLQFATHTINSKRAFSKELALVSNKALIMMLNRGK